jgi:hypothetical protein
MQLDYKFNKVMDLELWKQKGENGELTGQDNTRIFHILEETEGIDYNFRSKKSEDSA